MLICKIIGHKYEARFDKAKVYITATLGSMVNLDGATIESPVYIGEVCTRCGAELAYHDHVAEEEPVSGDRPQFAPDFLNKCS